MPSVEPTRLFATDFSCKNDIILAYSFKKFNRFDEVQVVLHLKDESNGTYCQVICGANDHVYEHLAPGQKLCALLMGIDLKKVLIHLSTKQEHQLPSTTVNGWEAR